MSKDFLNALYIHSFPLSNLKLPGSSRAYKAISSCHHRGSLKGDWFTKELTKYGWYELDDLKKNSITKPPGYKDDSVAILLLVADDKF